MRNKVTLDMMESCGCDCKCIISESDGTNTLELYMWSVSSEAAIVFSWTDPDGTGHLEGALGTFLDNGDYYYSANPEIFTGNRLITMTVNWDGFTSREIYFQCVNLTAETNFTVTRDLSADDLYRVAAATDDDLPIATTTSTGVVQIGTGLNVDETGVISTPIASKEALGIVKIGDGINVSEGTISLPPATDETLGGVIFGDNLMRGSDGTIGVPLATTEYPGVVQVGNGLSVDENGVISTNQFGGNVILIDHTPTTADLTHTNAVLVQYDKDNEILSDDKSKLYPVTATFAEIVKEYEFDYTGIFGYYDMLSLDLDNALWKNKVSSNYNIALTGGSVENSCLHLTENDYGTITCDEPMTIYVLFKTYSTGNHHSIISKHMTTYNQYHDFAIVINPKIILSCRLSVVTSTVNAQTSHVVCITRNTTSAKLYIDGVYIGSTTTALGDYYGEYTLNKSLRGDGTGDMPGNHLYRMLAVGSNEHTEAQIINNSTYLLKTYGVIT